MPESKRQKTEICSGNPAETKERRKNRPQKGKAPYLTTDDVKDTFCILRGEKTIGPTLAQITAHNLQDALTTVRERFKQLEMGLMSDVKLVKGTWTDQEEDILQVLIILFGPD